MRKFLIWIVLVSISLMAFPVGAYRYSPILTVHGCFGYDLWEGIYKREYEENGYYESSMELFALMALEGGASLGLIVPFPNTSFVLDLNGRVWKNFSAIFISPGSEESNESVEIQNLGYMFGVGIGNGYELRPLGNTGRVESISVSTFGVFYGTIPALTYTVEELGIQGMSENVLGFFFRGLSIRGGFSFETFTALLLHLDENEDLKVFGALFQLGIGFGAYGTIPINQ